MRVNDAMIEFYWNLGHDIVDMKAEAKWGEGIIKQLSLDMKDEFPDIKGFSTTNLWYVKQWYTFYRANYTKLQQLVGDIVTAENLQQHVGETEEESKRHQDTTEITYPYLFGLIPWGQHIMIVTKCKDIEEAIFYMSKSISAHWSRRVLESFIESDLFHSQGRLPTNFDKTLPPEYRSKVTEILKDPYDLGFVRLPTFYKEHDLEDALTHNITRFLLELGKGFTFYGRQVELIVSGTSYFLDMLFYHVRLKCYVVVELKATDFIPEYAGKLNFYVTAVDHLLKLEDDKPTIGLLICKSKDNTKVEWSFDGIGKPIGVATYDLHKNLPTAEELESQIKLMNKV
uniref:PDDEXK nuclease domain-containing protein n=1 Tax=Prevotella sp. GTC17262 TaxID=3236797 RepID=A0AB33JPP7_9BACT